MQVIYPGYSSPTRFYQAPSPQIRPGFALPVLTINPANQSLHSIMPFSQGDFLTKKTVPQTPTPKERLISALKATALIIPAILLAKFLPSKATSSILPSDWKVWAKIILSVASLSQLNKALQIQPPPWLGAMMNVLLITPLIAGKSGLRLLPVLLPSVGALVQGTHILSQKTEKPLNDKLHIPPMATRLIFSVLSMGVGIVTLPRLLGAFKELIPKTKAGITSTSSVIATCSRGCCTSPICLTEIAEYATALIGWFQGQFKERK
jgi:hypothetical protein